MSTGGESPNKSFGSELFTRVGPCMEFVIEKQILDILSTLCQADIPPGEYSKRAFSIIYIFFEFDDKQFVLLGLRPHIIRIFIFLMTHIKQTILPYIGVYLPIRYITLF